LLVRAWERGLVRSNGIQSISIMSDHSLAALKQKAATLGLSPYASLYGDRRQRATWEKLIQSADELTPLLERQPDRTQINWKFAIAVLIGAIALGFLLQPLRSKCLSFKINIQIGTK